MRVVVAFCLFALIVAGTTLGLPANSVELPAHSSSTAETIRSLPVTQEIAVESNEWPQLFGPSHRSESPESGSILNWTKAGPTELWRKQIGTGYSAPVVFGQRLIVHFREGDEEIVRCLNVDDGETIWEHGSPTEYHCDFPPYSSGPYSTPIITEERVFALGAEGLLHCLAADSGDVLWKRQVNDEYKVPTLTFAVGHTPLLHDNRLIMNVGGTVSESGIVALDPESGDELWKATDHRSAYCTPVPVEVDGRQLIFVLTDFGPTVIDPSDGSVLDSVELHSPNTKDAPSAVTPLVVGDRVFVSIYQVGSFLFRIGRTGAIEQLWKNRRTFESQFNPLVHVDGHVYGWHFFDKSLRCFELATGKLKWKWKSKLRRGTQIALDGRLLLFGEQGHLGWVDTNPAKLTKGVITTEPLLAKPCYSTPALSRGRLFVRNEQEVACYELNPSSSEPDSVARQAE